MSRTDASASRPATRAWRAVEQLAEEFGGVQIARGAAGASGRGWWFVRVSTSTGEYAMQSTDLAEGVEALALQVKAWAA